jgi:hypothetical protein
VKTISELPEGYRLIGKIDISKDHRLLWGLQLAGLVAFFIFGWAFLQAAYILNPHAEQILSISSVMDQTGDGGFSLTIPGAWLLGFIAAMILMIVFHEAVHGLFFWLFTARRPRFGFKGAYAYAALPPGIYLPRSRYLIVGAAPLVLLSFIGLLFLTFAPAWALPGLLIFLVSNATGSIGDLYVIYWLSRMPDSILIQDHGDMMMAFGP